ncbi:UDP-glucose 4-epimerase [Nymphon striatum]|nr:UDP-glucose 4-epimerase [Nymphon striatum]
MSSEEMILDTFFEDLESNSNTAPNVSSKQSQLSSTLRWVEENYELSEGVCLPRSVLYQHYVDHCKQIKWTPSGPATFGKILRQKFPKITTRRLGTRGQSKYHYYGIGIKKTSHYYQQVYAANGQTRFSGGNIKTEGANQRHLISSKAGTFLPKFIELEDFDPDKLQLSMMRVMTAYTVKKIWSRDSKTYGIDFQTFLAMYRTHCQRIFDAVITANFNEIQSFLHQFWHDVQQQHHLLLNNKITECFVAVSDIILYKVLTDVIIPSTVQDIPESLKKEIKEFLRNLPEWYSEALKIAPVGLQRIKLQILQNFIRCVKRQLSFISIAQAARCAMASPHGTDQMLRDIMKIDIKNCCKQMQYVTQDLRCAKIIFKVFNEFVRLLKNRSSVEQIMEWLDSVTHKYVKENCCKAEKESFFMIWSYTSSMLMKDLTLQSASSFGSFHLVRLMVEEYIYLIFESRSAQNQENEIVEEISCFLRKPDEIKARIKNPINFVYMCSNVNEENVLQQSDILHKNSNEPNLFFGHENGYIFEGCFQDSVNDYQNAYSQQMNHVMADQKPSMPSSSVSFRNLYNMNSARGTVFITGGAGYIGSHCIVELIEAGYDIVVVDNLINSIGGPQKKPAGLARVEKMTGKNINFYNCDLLDPESVDTVFKKHKIDFVIHMASLKAVGESMKIPLEYYKNNTIATINLIELMTKYNVHQLIFSSSCTVYGEPKYLPLDEKHPTEDILNAYARTKRIMEQMLHDLHRLMRFRWNIIILRYFNPIGAHTSGRIGEDPVKAIANIMPYIAKVAHGQKESFTIFGGDYPTVDGTAVRDYIHVMDLATAHVAAIQKLSRAIGYEIYNLGSGKGTSVLQLIKEFEKASNKKVEYEILPKREGDNGATYADISLAEKELGWKPIKTLKDMCEDFWRWQDQNPEGYRFTEI